MPEDASPNGGAPRGGPAGPGAMVSEMQAKLHRWAVADPGRRFDDLFNLVCDPATLLVAFDRVAGNHGANTPGVDGWTVAEVEERIGAPGFLQDLRAVVKAGSFRPLPVRERKIPKPGGAGKFRKIGIPVIADRVVQAALKLVLEPIFEADFLPVSYGFRPLRRAHDAIAEIHHFGTRGYRWVLDADIEAAFDSLSHSALMERIRLRVKDKRVLALVKSFLKAGILTELGEVQGTMTGTPQGGILSPLIFNVAMSVLDEHVMEPWKPGGSMSTNGKRAYRRSKGAATWRIVRYADDFVILVHGSRENTEALREDVAAVLAPLGLRLSPSKTQVVHMGDGFDFLGFRIRWKRKRGTNKWYEVIPVVWTHHGDHLRGRVLPDPGCDGLPLQLPGHEDPDPMATCEPRLTAGTVESPLPRDRHGGFGERSGETDREQSRHRAPGRLTNRIRRSLAWRAKC
ncbi:reverse transcriptase domain-containing protein [Streptomyces sp. NPDC005498]|uniref:reverse transcriptase domain-containing protein n=1 Tax=Streptomyces sp. NPDC005498 TaxID=3364717 RepID=UPI003679D962